MSKCQNNIESKECPFCKSPLKKYKEYRFSCSNFACRAGFHNYLSRGESMCMFYLDFQESRASIDVVTKSKEIIFKITFKQELKIFNFNKCLDPLVPDQFEEIKKIASKIIKAQAFA
jgi:hypothetical protein